MFVLLVSSDKCKIFTIVVFCGFVKIKKQAVQV